MVAVRVCVPESRFRNPGCSGVSTNTPLGLHGVGAQLLVARDRDGDAEEPRISASVDQLDLLEQLISASCHTTYDGHGHSFL
jgi:hypothetical protein